MFPNKDGLTLTISPCGACEGTDKQRQFWWGQRRLSHAPERYVLAVCCKSKRASTETVRKSCLLSLNGTQMQENIKLCKCCWSSGIKLIKQKYFGNGGSIIGVFRVARLINFLFNIYSKGIVLGRKLKPSLTNWGRISHLPEFTGILLTVLPKDTFTFSEFIVRFLFGRKNLWLTNANTIHTWFSSRNVLQWSYPMQ